jgi:hypothetical protein
VTRAAAHAHDIVPDRLYVVEGDCAQQRRSPAIRDKETHVKTWAADVKTSRTPDEGAHRRTTQVGPNVLIIIIIIIIRVGEW